MPHIVIECSANVARLTAYDSLIAAVHDAAIATGIAPLDALRTRLVAHEHYLIADGRPENGFIAVTVRLAAGRSVDDQQRLVTALLAAIEGHLGDGIADTAISVEYQEIDPAKRVNANRLRARLGADTRAGGR